MTLNPATAGVPVFVPLCRMKLVQNCEGGKKKLDYIPPPFFSLFLPKRCHNRVREIPYVKETIVLYCDKSLNMLLLTYEQQFLTQTGIFML